MGFGAVVFRREESATPYKPFGALLLELRLAIRAFRTMYWNVLKNMGMSSACR
jgi:hypothetical protein